MKAKAYLSRVGTEYKHVRELRERLGKAGSEKRRRELREVLKRASARYAGILQETWTLLEQVATEEEQELLVRKYIYLETMDRIAVDMGLSKHTGYSRHLASLRTVQRLLDEEKKGRECA